MNVTKEVGNSLTLGTYKEEAKLKYQEVCFVKRRIMEQPSDTVGESNMCSLLINNAAECMKGIKGKLGF